jgi:hypothetical protein
MVDKCHPGLLYGNPVGKYMGGNYFCSSNYE